MATAKSKPALVSKSKTQTLTFKIDTHAFLHEMVDNALPQSMGILKIPLNVFRQYLVAITERCLEINDPVLNMICCNMALYEQASHYSNEYNPKMVRQVEKEFKAYLKTKKEAKS